MTTTEALTILQKADPTKSWFATKQSAIYDHTENKSVETEYTISSLPGLNGSKCQQIKSSEGFDAPVQQFLSIINSIPATPNDE
jgi:hypothetical protein